MKCAKEQKGAGDGGYRSPYLSHAKRALYHLSYVPMCTPCLILLSFILSCKVFLEQSETARVAQSVER